MAITNTETQQISTLTTHGSICPQTCIPSPKPPHRNVNTRRGLTHKRVRNTVTSQTTPTSTQKSEEKLMTDTISLLIADDYAIIRRGIRAFIERQPDLHIMGEVDSGEAAVLLAAEILPDVVLMDLVMPGIGGIEATRQLKRVSPRSQIIILTAHDEDKYILPALQAGALSYLLKDIEVAELTETVRKAAHGEPILHSRVAAHIFQVLYGTRHPSLDISTDLSDHEQEVLRLMADGLSHKEIALKLIISEMETKVHVKNIVTKLQTSDRSQATDLP
jgi:two-component system, NarL family, response regulator LiaR